MASVSTLFDVFALRPVQEAVQETFDITYKPMATVDQTDFLFSIPADRESYIETNIHI